MTENKPKKDIVLSRAEALIPGVLDDLARRGEAFTATEAAEEVMRRLGRLSEAEEELVRRWWANVAARGDYVLPTRN